MLPLYRNQSIDLHSKSIDGDKKVTDGDNKVTISKKSFIHISKHFKKLVIKNIKYISTCY